MATDMTTEPDDVVLTAAEVSSAGIRALVEGVTYRQLDHWSRIGLLRTVGWDGQRNPPTGYGHHRMHPTSEVAVIATVVRLISSGFNVGAAFDVARALSGQPRTALPGGFDLIDTAAT